MTHLNSTASAWDRDISFEAERMRSIDRFTDDREDDWEPCYMFFDEEE